MKPSCLGALVIAALIILVLGTARAQDSASATAKMSPASAALRKAATASVLAQLQAFAKDDYSKAVQYQSAGLKQNFPTIALFRQMMTTTYPEFAHYKSVRFGAALADSLGQHVLLPVTLTGQDGVTIKALYLLVKEGKTYKIDGVSGGSRAPLPVNPGNSVDA